MNVKALLVVILLWGACSNAAEDGSWSRFRGPNGSGIGQTKGLPLKWTDADYNWKIKLPGTGHSSPVVWGQRVFITCGHHKTAQRLILCVDAPTGRILWQREYNTQLYTQHSDNAYASSTPVVDAEGAIVSWTTPQQVLLLALDNDGREVWKREWGPFIAIYGSAVSPILVNDMVILHNDQDDPKANPSVYGKNATHEVGKSFVIAVDRKTGKTRWQTERTSEMCTYGTPTVYQGEDGRPQIIMATKAHGIYALNAADGKVLWELPGLFKGRVIASPVISEGLIVVSSGIAASGWRCVVVRPGSVDGKTPPKLLHEFARPVPMVPTPLVKDGLVFLWCDIGTAACFRLVNGQMVWREQVEGAYYSSPVWCEGRLYCATRSGEMVVISASEKFEQLARVPLGERCYATPAISEGVMYIRTTSSLMSLGPR